MGTWVTGPTVVQNEIIVSYRKCVHLVSVPGPAQKQPLRVKIAVMRTRPSRKTRDRDVAAAETLTETYGI